ncbi:hypothetical protein [[Actinomadura] parvosata]|uniref:hypothetical protein n=1 Tax=[Actinomadura] parvosata TaxID=1955412 RepID=UPI001646C487
MKGISVRTRTDGGLWLRGGPAVTNTREPWRRFDDRAFAGIEKGETHDGDAVLETVVVDRAGQRPR